MTSKHVQYLTIPQVSEAADLQRMTIWEEFKASQKHPANSRSLIVRTVSTIIWGALDIPDEATDIKNPMVY